MNTPDDFPLGYHGVHSNVSLNFQFNRWFNWVGDPIMLDEVREASTRVRTYPDLQRDFLLLAESALLTAANLKAAYYLRATEFFMANTDPQRLRVRSKFIALMRSYYGHGRFEQHRVPYIDGLVKGLHPAYRFTPPDAKGVIIFFGGFDSYIEELFKFFVCWRDAGYDVVAFEGPGQGGALFDANLSMTHEWEKAGGGCTRLLCA